MSCQPYQWSLLFLLPFHQWPDIRRTHWGLWTSVRYSLLRSLKIYGLWIYGEIPEVITDADEKETSSARKTGRVNNAWMLSALVCIVPTSTWPRKLLCSIVPSLGLKHAAPVIMISFDKQISCSFPVKPSRTLILMLRTCISVNWPNPKLCIYCATRSSFIDPVVNPKVHSRADAPAWGVGMGGNAGRMYVLGKL